MKIPDLWTFKSDYIANNFDAHVREQLPWYDIITNAVAHIIRAYLPENGVVYDIGASTGNIEIKIANLIKERNADFIAIDESESMKKAYRGKNLIIANATKFDYKNFDVAVMFLSLMFFNVTERRSFINNLRSKINHGGAIIIVDKTLPSDTYSSFVTSKLNILFKKERGIPSDEIIEKELSLVGMQRPLDRGMFLDYGYEWFRLGDFSGWIIEG